jgi:drug/metabolite transporter (DMT)-like permease
MTKKSALIYLHIIVLLYGFTGIIAKLIYLPSMKLVWFRVGIATISLLLISPFYRKLQKITNKKHLLYVVLVGVFLALHWVSFFEAIAVSNVTVCLIGVSTFPLFTSILEPLYFKEDFNKKNLAFSLLIVLGILIISVGNTMPSHIYLGLSYGILAALLASIFTIMNRNIVQKYNGFTIGVYQLGVAFIFLSSFNINFFSEINSITTSDLIYLLILAILCTSVAHVLNIVIMKHIKAFTVSLTINLEPIYGILLAVLIFRENESLNLQFYIGAFVIIASVFSQALASKNKIFLKYI